MSRAVQEVRRAIASKFGRHNSPRRAPTRGAPTNCQSFSDKEPGSSRQRRREIATTHYDLHSSRRFGLGRAPTRGAPTDCFLRLAWGGHPQGGDCLLSAFWPWEGHPQGGPYRLSSLGGPTHKGCPYRLFSVGVFAWGGHPQGVPLPIVFCRRLALGRAPTRGAPTDCFLRRFLPGEGTHKGCPYRLFSVGVWPWGGHPQGVPLPIVFCRRFGLGRAPTRGAPTDCRRFGLGRAPTRGAPTDCFLSAFWPGEGAHKGRPYPIQAASRGFSNLMQLPCGGARRRFLGGCCLKQDLQDFWGFSGLRSSG